MFLIFYTHTPLDFYSIYIYIYICTHTIYIFYAHIIYIYIYMRGIIPEKATHYRAHQLFFPLVRSLTQFCPIDLQLRDIEHRTKNVVQIKYLCVCSILLETL